MGITKLNQPQVAAPGSFTPRTFGSPIVDVASRVMVQLTAAQIFAMNGTPVQVLPAPLASQMLLIDSITFQMKPGGTPFAAGGAVTFQYHGTSTNPHAANVPAATVNSASASETALPPPAGATVIPLGTGLDITNATAAFTTGNGTAIVTVVFRVFVVV